MTSGPRTLIEFQEMFPDEDACWVYLRAVRWPDGFVCPHCGHRKGWLGRRGPIQCAACSSQTSVTAGTIFHRRRKPLTMWFLLGVVGHESEDER